VRIQPVSGYFVRRFEVLRHTAVSGNGKAIVQTSNIPAENGRQNANASQN